MKRFDIYERKPAGMEAYLRNYGWHFSKKMYEFAVSKMEDRNKKSLSPISKEALYTAMKQNGFTSDFEGYDACYVYSMARADYFGSTITTEQQLLSFVNDYLNDVDGYEGIAFTRFYADCVASGKVILWEEML